MRILYYNIRGLIRGTDEETKGQREIGRWIEANKKTDMTTQRLIGR